MSIHFIRENNVVIIGRKKECENEVGKIISAKVTFINNNSKILRHCITEDESDLVFKRNRKSKVFLM